MTFRPIHSTAAAAAVLLACSFAHAQAEERVNPRPVKRNILLFVADGLRNSAVNPTDAPTMMKLRAAGVEFANSHSLFPTFTMPNASAIATGHGIGDTGVYVNSPFIGFTGISNSMLAPLENDIVLRDTNEHFDNRNFVNETSLVAAARQAGFHTAIVGKHGPSLMQDVTQNNDNTAPATVIIDDATGSSTGVALPDPVRDALEKASLPTTTPSRGANSTSGNFQIPGTTRANVAQQAYMLQATTRVILPSFINDAANKNPFVLVYWSRDPDGSQHNEGDNFNAKTGLADRLGDGINGPTGRAGVNNADTNLAALLEYLDKTDDPQHPGQKLAANTDVFITSDHGFGTISRHDLPDGKAVSDFASTLRWFDPGSVPPEQDTVDGFLPPGFLAIDIAEKFKFPMWDAGTVYRKAPAAAGQTGAIQFVPVDPHRPNNDDQLPFQHPDGGNAILGGTGRATITLDARGKQFGKLDAGARLVVVAGGGSNLIYFPNLVAKNGKASPEDIAFVKELVTFLGSQTYVGGVVVDGDLFGPIPGAIAMADVGLKGSAQTPRPALIVSFTTFSMDPKNPLYTGVEIADGGLQQGQGMHGSFARFDTFNNMIAFGPDFKTLRDTDPVSNADVAPTLAYLLGLKLGGVGQMKGRVIEEALKENGTELHGADKRTLPAEPTADGFHTVLRYQVMKDSTGKEYRYYDSAGHPGRVVTGE